MNDRETIILADFGKGLLSKRLNRINFPHDAVIGGQNVDLSAGIRTRDGSSIVSDGSLPVGTVRALKQARYPTNEQSRIIAEVEYEPQWLPGTDGIARADHSAVWDSERGRMLVFGGMVWTFGSDYAIDTFSAYYPGTDTWTEISPEDTEPPPPWPGARYGHAAFYDATTDCMWILLGYGTSGDLYDVWKYDCATNTWEEQTVTGAPPANRRGAYRTVNRTFIVFETGYPEPTTYVKFSVATLAWSTVAVTYTGTGTNYPTPENSVMRCVYDSESDQMVAFGGGYETPAIYPAILDFSHDRYSLGAVFPDPDGRGQFGALCCSGQMVVASGTNFAGGDIGASGTLSVYDIGTNTWSTDIPQGTITERENPTIVTTDTGGIVAFGGQTIVSSPEELGDVYTLDLSICGGIGTLGGGCDLYASDDLLPTTTATFTSIYALGVGAGTVTIDSLNDRTIITEGINEPPLVYGGAESTDGSDWLVPKAALARPNGIDAYDVTSQVCDKDPDTVADVGNWLGTGDLLLCLDMPKTSGVYVQVGTPNTGIPESDQVFYEELTFTEYSEINRQDLSATITNWVQSSGSTGHFTDGASTVTIGTGYTNPNVREGCAVIIGTTTRYIMDVVHGGAGVAEVTLDDTQASAAVDYIYGTEIYVAYDDIRGPITNWVQDSGAGGHVTDGSSTLSLGPGNTVPQIVVGLIVTISGAEYEILTITGDGTGSSGVTLDAVRTSAAVTAIRTESIVNSGATLSGSDGSYSTILTKTLDQPNLLNGGCSVRQAFNGSEFTGGGDIVRWTYKAHGSTTIGGYTNAGLNIIAASIVEQDGDTWAGTTTPTMAKFNGGQAGATTVAAGTITTDPVVFTINPAKDYLIITDYGAAI